ncbi:unnamed protein product, partial [Phaeothamnion confervicola]
LGFRRGLRAPWDVALLDNFVYVSSAGGNQIWQLDSAGADMRPIAGSGRRGRRDCPVDGYKLSDTTRFAQPSGIAGTLGRLVVCDADSSSLRSVDFRANAIGTALGGDTLFKENLSAFGDKDGFGASARLQHPTGLCTVGAGRLLCADTFNHKLKSITVTADESSSRPLAGDGVRGHRDGPAAAARFNCPGAAAAAPELGRAWVCDVGNNVVRVVDLTTGNVSTLSLTGAPPVDG